MDINLLYKDINELLKILFYRFILIGKSIIYSSIFISNFKYIYVLKISVFSFKK